MYFGRKTNMMSERQKLLLKKELKLEECGEFTLTREEEIEALKTLIHCIKVTGNITDENCQEMFERESEKINKKYNYNMKESTGKGSQK